MAHPREVCRAFDDFLGDYVISESSTSSPDIELVTNEAVWKADYCLAQVDPSNWRLTQG